MTQSKAKTSLCAPFNYVGSLIKETFSHWSNHHPGRLGAALSYYAVFSILPLFLIIIALTGLFVDKNLVQANIMYYIEDAVGVNAGEYIKNLLQGTRHQTTTIAAAIISIGTLIFGAIGVFSELNNALDELWHLEPKGKKVIEKEPGVWKKIVLILRHKITSFSVVPLIGILLLLSIGSTIFLPAIATKIPWLFPYEWSLKLAEIIVSLVLSTILFSLIYKILPNLKLPWKELIIGSMVTSLLFLIGKLLIGTYLTTLANTSTFGAAGALVAILLWVYYSSQVFFIGASYIFVYSRKSGYLKNK